MKTTFKRLGCMLLVALMVVGCLISVSAAKVTIKNDKYGQTHDYVAYKIFDATITEKDGKKILTDVKWATGVDGNAIISALKTANSTKYASVTNVDSLLKVLESTDFTADDAVVFADVVGDYMIENGTPENSLEDLAPGYYVFVDTTKTEADDDEDDDNIVDAKGRFTLKVVDKDIEVDPKVDKPTVDKVIVENKGKDGQKDVKENMVGIGDDVNYKITSTVPNTTGYDYYFFIFNDTLSKGLTYNDGSLTVTVTPKNGGEKRILSAPDEYVLEKINNLDGTTTIKVHIKDIVENYNEGDIITVEYSAKLNENANIGAAGNPNDVKLEYSNDPTHNYDGDKDEDGKPNDGTPTGETPESEVKTYTTGIELKKVDENGNALSGAIFKVHGITKKTVLVTGTWFEKDTDGAYWKLKDGSFTTTDPNTEGVNKDLYADTTTKYKKVEGEREQADYEEVDFTVEVGEDGMLKIEGLGPGEYTITEIKAPDGYNLLKDPITIKVEASYDGQTKKVTWTVKKDGTLLEDKDNNNLFEFEVKNNKGTELPETGGIGTTIFYVVGALLVVGAGVLLITKRRMRSRG